ncbi:MAG: DUF3617 domain-containing protein [Tsuneonella sp.]
MRLLVAAIPLAALALAACNKEPAKPKTPEEVAAAASKLAKPMPGLYKSSAKLMDFSIPGLPQDQADKMKAMIAKGETQDETYCLTKEEADKGFEDAVRKMASGQNGMKCTFAKFDTAGDSIDAEMTCSGPGGTSANMKLDGEMAAQSSRLHMKMTQKVAAMPAEMHMEMEVSSKRIGECK